MSKYIIEVPVDAQYIMINGVRMGDCYTQTTYIADIEELNSDYINEHFGELQDEAYQRGINDGSLDVKQRAEGAYQKGLDAAWEAVKKISLMPPDEIEKVFPGAAKYNRYNLGYSGVEAIAKLKAYEEKQKADDEIKVGDEVIDTQSGAKFCVTHFWANNHGEKGVSGFNHECPAFQDTFDKVKKTGRHFDIDKILEAMKE